MNFPMCKLASRLCLLSLLIFNIYSSSSLLEISFIFVEIVCTQRYSMIKFLSWCCSGKMGSPWRYQERTQVPAASTSTFSSVQSQTASHSHQCLRTGYKALPWGSPAVVGAAASESSRMASLGSKSIQI